jgi:hypothetical protein
MDIAGYNMPGLLARAYSAGTNGAEIGSPFVLGTTTNGAPATVVNGESFVSYCRFEEFGIGTYPRLNVDSFVLQSIQPDPNDGKVWLLMYRTKGTDFSFYKRSSAAAPWENIPLKTSYHETSFANQPMQVGIMAGPWSGPGDLRTAALDNFMLDWTTAPTPVITVSGGNVIVSWPPDPQLVLQSTTSLSPPVTWSNESGATLGPTGYSLSFPLNAVTGKFFRLKQ